MKQNKGKIYLSFVMIWILMFHSAAFALENQSDSPIVLTLDHPNTFEGKVVFPRTDMTGEIPSIPLPVISSEVYTSHYNLGDEMTVTLTNASLNLNQTIPETQSIQVKFRARPASYAFNPDDIWRPGSDIQLTEIGAGTGVFRGSVIIGSQQLPVNVGYQIMLQYKNPQVPSGDVLSYGKDFLEAIVRITGPANRSMTIDADDYAAFGDTVSFRVSANDYNQNREEPDQIRIGIELKNNFVRPVYNSGISMIVSETGADTGEFEGQATLVHKEGHENLLNKDPQLRKITQDLNQSGGLLVVNPGDVISFGADVLSGAGEDTGVNANKQIVILSTDDDIEKLREEVSQASNEVRLTDPSKPVVKTEIKMQVGDTQLIKKDSVSETVIKMDIPPKIVNNRVFIPLRFLAESLAAKILWEEETQSITIRYEEKEISFQEARSIQGADAVPFIENGRMMVPVRVVFEFFLTSVDWFVDLPVIHVSF